MKKSLRANIVLIGTGGTGSYVLSSLARYLSGYLQNNPEYRVCLALVDGDHVEKKNLDRQMFIEDDIGEAKCIALGMAIGECFPSVTVKTFPEYLIKEERLGEIFKACREETKQNKTTVNMDILIGCVDNHRARQVMHKYFKNAKEGNFFYIDSANEFTKGEVVVGIKAFGKEASPDRAFYFPDILRSREKRADQLSCSVVNVSQPQHIVTNMLAANIVLQKVFAILELRKTAARGGITYFDAETGDMLTRGADDVLKERKSS